jgi:hypothetical protein
MKREKSRRNILPVARSQLVRAEVDQGASGKGILNT